MNAVVPYRIILPITTSSSRFNSNPFLSLQIHRIHLRTNSIFPSNLMNLMNPSGVKQNPLRQRRLTGINMRRDPYVTDHFHRFLPPWLFIGCCRFCSGEVAGWEMAEVGGSGKERDCGGWSTGSGCGGGKGAEEALGGGFGEACHGGGGGGEVWGFWVWREFWRNGRLNP